NYRPISNLTSIFKIIERAALRRIQPYITSYPNYSPLQSAIQINHSTETALLHIPDNVFNLCNNKKN
ncbi:hypothetical protein HELRODRAFT_127032, partial [Helobdella robusta]|uniref:Uncharacterized protein n=1 Tax=Helobdella robusta TaxID=6412 RepID=T1EHC5_HELRO